MPFASKSVASASEYVAALPPDRKQSISTVRNLIKKHLPKGYVESTQYGMIAYVVPLSTFPEGYLGKKDVPLPYICLASQKNHMAVYLMCVDVDAKLSGWFAAAWKKAGKKLDMGKSCLRFTSVDDLALDVLGEAVARVPVKDYVSLYSSQRGSRRSAKKKTSNPAKTSSTTTKAKNKTKASARR